jgi:dihydroorotase-like cyclic amidohydrolase
VEVLPLGVEIVVKAGRIFCLGISLERGPSTQVINAEGAYIAPGGVDSHVHFAQANSPTGDDWETGSRSAIAGGNTTVMAFASQEKHNLSVFPEEYHKLAQNQSYCDYGFYLILTNPTPTIMKEEILKLIEMGITSAKLYITYQPMKLGDADLLSVMMSARSIGFTTMVHAENIDITDLITTHLEAAGHTTPFFHSTSSPKIAEDEATYRIISLATLISVPILIVHMSSPQPSLPYEKPKRTCSPPMPKPAHNTSSSSPYASKALPMRSLKGRNASVAPGCGIILGIWRQYGKAWRTRPSPRSLPTTRPECTTFLAVKSSVSSRTKKK